jgi:hypothetical protein
MKSSAYDGQGVFVDIEYGQPNNTETGIGLGGTGRRLVPRNGSQMLAREPAALHVVAASAIFRR